MNESTSSMQKLGFCPSTKLLLRKSDNNVAAQNNDPPVEMDVMEKQDNENEHQQHTDTDPGDMINAPDNSNEEQAVHDSLSSQHENRRLHSRLLQGEFVQGKFVNIIQDIDNVNLDLDENLDLQQNVDRAQLFQEALEKRQTGSYLL